jgi:hypothetical protein
MRPKKPRSGLGSDSEPARERRPVGALWRVRPKKPHSGLGSDSEPARERRPVGGRQARETK